MKFETLPGFRAFYPEACAARNHIFRIWRQTAIRFGFQEWDGPILEPLELYIEKSGPEIVSQLFHFTDKGGRDVAMRPELTPTLARLVGIKANSLKRPVKWFAVGENFRYERPQKGRLRSHYQFNADVFGEAGPGADAEVIALAVHSLAAMQLTPEEIVVRLSDRTLWSLYLEGLGLEGDAAYGILQAIDKLEREDRARTIEKLKPFFNDATEDFLAKVEALMQVRELEDLRAFFVAHAPTCDVRDRYLERLQAWEELLFNLEALGVQPFLQIDLGIVRGLAYYTGFVFEIFERGGEGRSICGGGRYDHLVEKLGGPELPAVGFGLGDVTLADLLESRGKLPNVIQVPDLYLVAAGENERRHALEDATRLRQAGFSVEYPLRAVGFGKQFKTAGQSGARFALIYGEDELSRGIVKAKDLQTGGEAELARIDLVNHLSSLFEEGIEPKDDA